MCDFDFVFHYIFKNKKQQFVHVMFVLFSSLSLSNLVIMIIFLVFVLLQNIKYCFQNDTSSFNRSDSNMKINEKT